jgi:hypothetical protein
MAEIVELLSELGRNIEVAVIFNDIDHRLVLKSCIYAANSEIVSSGKVSNNSQL